MDIGLARQIQIHLMTFAEVVARVARWIIAWMAYGGVVFVLIALEIGIRYAIQVYFGKHMLCIHAVAWLRCAHYGSASACSACFNLPVCAPDKWPTRPPSLQPLSVDAIYCARHAVATAHCRFVLVLNLSFNSR